MDRRPACEAATADQRQGLCSGPTGNAFGSYPLGRLIEKTPGGIRVLGFSLAGEETVVAAPEYDVCFDVGRAPREVISIDNICLTHGHMDHAAGIVYFSK